MPNARKLFILATLRQTAGIPLKEMARACGLSGSRAYESASAWERGKSIPHSRLRPKFIEYLTRMLGLQHDLGQLEKVWEVLVEEWGWEPLSCTDIQQLFIQPRQVETEIHAVPGIQVYETPVEAVMLLEHLPTTGPLPSPGTLPPGSRMPFSRNPLFVGRANELRTLATIFKRNQAVGFPSTGIVAVSGLGGMGKTELAVEFVHRYGQYFAGGVFWLSFTDPNAVPAEIASCGGADHLALRPDFEQLPIEQQVSLVRDAWDRPLPRLLIFDNCEDPALLERWRPHSDSCRVVITSRRTQWNVALGVHSLLLSVLTREESIALLQKHCPDLSRKHVALTAIAAELDDLPLALHLAGHYLARYRPEVSAAIYVHQLRSSELLDHPSLQAGGVSPTAHDQNVARTFALSYQQLDTSTPIGQLARALLSRAAHFAPGELIPRELLLATLELPPNEHQATEALTHLVELGLVESIGEAADYVCMHRLLVAFVRQLGNDHKVQLAANRVC